jgi:hypothetical protein
MDRRHSKTKCPLYAFRIVHANNQTLEIVVEAKCRQQTKFLDEPSAVSRQPSCASSRDINWKGDEDWHLDNPHNKALAALFYTSLQKGTWEMAVRFRGSLLSLLPAGNRRNLPQNVPVSGNGTTS